MIGSRPYELTNHLGNVLATLNDKKIGNDSSGFVNYYVAEVLSQNDYYPFGMGMVERKYVIGNAYRYGFNSKEKEGDIKGKENAYDFGDRIFDPQLGRWLSVDVAAKSAPGWTPFRFGFDNPINFKDPNGQWEEDGHFWTVYAMGIALGLGKADARELAVKAEWYDHVVHKDNSLSIQKIPGKEFMAWGADGGIGTWADPIWQKTMHGLTGGNQDEVLSSSIANIIGGDLFQLHTLGDAWAHSYVDEKGIRVMYGKHGRK
jgi:RHS repeat-associated protein